MSSGGSKEEEGGVSRRRLTRKKGLSLIESPLIQRLRRGDLEQEEPEEAMEKVEEVEVRGEAVETFLDDNADFLEDYVRRKVHRSKLERWLFSPEVASVSAEQKRRKNTLPVLPPSCQQQQLQQQRRQWRQRSRSFTPLRRLSATKFEEGGLSTPIVVTDVDGQPTFLRTSPKSSGGGDASSYAKFSVSASSSSSSDHGQSLHSLLEDIFRETDSTGVVAKAGGALRAMTAGDRVRVLLTHPDHPFSGNLHVLDDRSGGSHWVGRCSAGRLMTGVITSGQLVSSQGPADEGEESEAPSSSSEAVTYCLTAPLFASPSLAGLGDSTLPSSTSKVYGI